MSSVTKHGSKRVKQRMGISKSSQDKLIAKALERGYKHNQTKGQLKKWIDKSAINKKYKGKYIVYGDKLYIFNKDDQLITLIQIPQNIMKNINKMIIKGDNKDDRKNKKSNNA